ncbi:MAG TPA: deaminase [Parcubacteria group bacterium]|nr:deaminase [Parcubacteria group bacterium]
MRKALVAYVPVLHQGYLDFFKRHKDAEELFIFSQPIIDKFDWLKRKDIRAVNPEEMLLALRALGIAKQVTLLDDEQIAKLRDSNISLVFADESESRRVVEEFFGESQVSFDSVFLRWDKPRVLDEKNAQGFPVTSEEVHRKFMDKASLASERSSDWWIHVGAVLVSGDRVVVGYNRHTPSEHTPYALGDPRSLFNKGIAVELTSALHAEGAIVGAALREGVQTKGASLYITHFPCPYCANILAETGIAEIYFRTGYSMLDGADLLRKAGIKLFQVVDEKSPE